MEIMKHWIIDRKPGHPPVYRLDIPNYTQCTVTLGNPGLVDPEAWMEDVRTSRAMPGWSGVINYFDCNDRPQSRTLVGYYQFVFPPESELAGVWRLEGLDGFGVGTRVILRNVVSNKSLTKTLEQTVYDENPTTVKDEYGYIPSFAEVLLEAEITPVYQISLLSNAGFHLQPKPLMLFDLMAIGSKLDFVFNGETYHFVIAANHARTAIALQPECRICLIANVCIIVNGMGYTLKLQTINQTLPAFSLDQAGYNLSDGEWVEFSNSLESYIGYLAMDHSRATVVTNLTLHHVSTQSVAMGVAKALSLANVLHDDLPI